MAQLWTEKYRPQALGDFVGHEAVVAAVIGEPLATRAILLAGPPGVGKTTLVGALAAELGYECVEYNASDVRSSTQLAAIREQLFNRTGIRSGKPILILLDEIDGIVSGDGVGEVVKLVKCPERRVPIMLTSNTNITALRSLCESYFMAAPGDAAIRRRLEEIARAEGIPFDPAVMAGCHGDIRQCIHRLQFGVPPEEVVEWDAPVPVYNPGRLFAWLLHEKTVAPDVRLMACPGSWREALRDAPSAGELTTFSHLSQWSLFKRAACGGLA